MIWTAKDDETIRECRRCLENCRHYNTLPAAWFPLCIKMYEVLKEAGLLEQQELEADYCAGCVFEIGGGCKKAYAEATLDESRKRVVNCKQKTSAKQNAALEKAAKRSGRRQSPSHGVTMTAPFAQGGLKAEEHKKRDTTCVSLAANRSRHERTEQKPRISMIADARFLRKEEF